MYRQHILSVYKRNISLISRSYHPTFSGKSSSYLIILDNLANKQHYHKLASSSYIFNDVKYFHTHNTPRKDPESKAEQTANLLKEKMINSEPAKQVTDLQTTSEPVRLSLWGRIVKECKHYYNGFKLLYLETKIGFGLFVHVLQGNDVMLL